MDCIASVLASALKGEDGLARPGRRLSLRNLLVVSQIVMSLVLLCATGLFLRSLERAIGIDIGFRSHNVLMLSVDPRVHGYTAERTTHFLEQLRGQIAAIPGRCFGCRNRCRPALRRQPERWLSMRKSNQSPQARIQIVELYMATSWLFRHHGHPPVSGSRLRP